MLVRERPPLRLDIDIETPAGRHVHWSEQESDPANVPSGVTLSSTMPGGHAEMGAVLPRKRGLVYDDLDRLSTVTVRGPGGDIAWQGRLERVPRSSGDKLSVSPGAVGFQAHLDDDKSAREIYRDIATSSWSGPSAARRLSHVSSFHHIEPTFNPDPITGIPNIRTMVAEPWGTTPGRPISEALYDAHGIPLGSVYVAWTRDGNTNNADTNWTWQVLLGDDISLASGQNSGNLRAAGPSSTTLTATTATRTAAAVNFLYANVAVNTIAGREYAILWTTPAVYGNHGLTLRGTEPNAGFYASDVVAHAVGQWCPLLNYTTGSGGSIRPSTFVIPHLTFPERTTAAEIIRGADRFHLSDWAVWDNKTFYYAPRGELGRSWRARASESQLEETGADTARLHNGALVEYRDVDGSTRTVGPTGSGADTTSSSLTDSDTENPANQLGIRRWTKLSMGVSTAAGATEVGRRFLEETKALDSSGRARIVGHVQDDKGVLHPAWRIRAGDTISFVDAGDFSPRRIVQASYDHSSRSCSVDLDAPPDSMDALLARLDVSIVSLGL